MSNLLLDLGDKTALITPTAIASTKAVAEKYSENLAEWLIEHITGTCREWNHEETVKGLTKNELELGCMETSDDAKLNSIALVNHDVGSRLLTVHHGHMGEKVWCITDGLFTDEQYTTFLFPEEY